MLVLHSATFTGNGMGRGFLGFFALEPEGVIFPAIGNLQLQFKVCGALCATSAYSPSRYPQAGIQPLV